MRDDTDEARRIANEAHLLGRLKLSKTELDLVPAVLAEIEVPVSDEVERYITN